MKTKEIVVVLTNKRYVALESNQIFDLWKNKSLKQIYEELHQRYPTYKIRLGSMDKMNFDTAVEVSNQYLNDHQQLEFINEQNSNYKNHNTMKRATFNTATAATLAKVAAGFTTNKVAGILHLTFQTGADALQFGADMIAEGEAIVIHKLDIHQESKEELIAIRKERTIGYQNMVKQAPKRAMAFAGNIHQRFSNINAPQEHHIM